MHPSILNLAFAAAFTACFVVPFYAPKVPLLARLPWALSAALYLFLITVAAILTWTLAMNAT